MRLGENKISSLLDCDFPADIQTCNNDSPPIQDIEVKSSISHSNYNKQKKVHDIALVYLKTEVNFRNIKNIGTVCLPVKQNQMIDSIKTFNNKNPLMTIAGWGRTEASSTISDGLLEAVVPYVQNTVCLKKLLEIQKIFPTLKFDLKESHLVKTLQITLRKIKNEISVRGRFQQDRCMFW